DSHQFLTIDEALGPDTVIPRTISFTRSAGVADPVLSLEDLGQNLVNEMLRLQDLKSKHAGNAKAIAGYNAQIDQLEQQLFELGLVEPGDPGLNNPDICVSPVSGYKVTYIVVPNILAPLGNISILADGLTGS